MGVVPTKVVRALYSQRSIHDAEVVVAVDESQNEDVFHHLESQVVQSE